MDVICNDRDSELIQQIVISTTDRADTWFWSRDDKGKYTVKSCYRMLQGENDCLYASF